MRSLPLLLVVVLTSVVVGVAAGDLPPPGTVLAERSSEIGFGFREVHRSKVNPPGHFEGVGHFGFMYYRDELLCQCGRTEVAISPDGKYSIFANSQNGRLTLYRSATRSRQFLSVDYVGYPAEVVWKNAEAIVTLVRYENGAARRSTFNVSL